MTKGEINVGGRGQQLNLPAAAAIGDRHGAIANGDGDQFSFAWNEHDDDSVPNPSPEPRLLRFVD